VLETLQCEVCDEWRPPVAYIAQSLVCSNFPCNIVVLYAQEDIVAVNQIFKDLGMLVHEQSSVIGELATITASWNKIMW